VQLELIIGLCRRGASCFTAGWLSCCSFLHVSYGWCPRNASCAFAVRRSLSSMLSVS